MVTSYGVTSARAFGRVLLTAACVALVATGAAAADGDDLLEPTPLILRDGRIAHVSVHAVPFDEGIAELAGAALARVEELSDAVATDCFLTAQVIGHVEPGEAQGGTTLDAHRLARARADAVQGLLMNSGLPATGIASVWDWQFLLREPRATLWLFRLNEGEDCDGTPLRPVAEAPAEVAAQEEPAQVVAEGEPAEVAAQEEVAPPPEPAVESAETVAAVPVPEPEPETEARPADAVPAPEPASEPAETAELTDPPADAAEAPATTPEAGDARTITSDEELAALAAPHAALAATPAPRATRPPAAAPEVLPAEPAAPAEAASAAPAIVVFPVNSSYFGEEGRRNLGSLVEGIDGEASYRVRLTATVGVGDVPGVSPEESVRYNRWLAERRLERVEEWLHRNAGSGLRIEREFRDGNERHVEVRVAPLG